MTTRITFVVLSLILPIFLFAQTRQIKGAVTDDKGAPVAGVSVIVKGTHNGTTTDAAGKFIFTIPGGSGKVTLIFSYLGYKQLETTADGSNPVTVSLQKEDNSLDDIVVIGYGTAKKRDLTGSVSSVGTKDLKDVPVNTVAEALAGRLAGVQVTTTEGRPGAEP